MTKKKKSGFKSNTESKKEHNATVTDWKAHRPKDSRQIKGNLMRRMGR